MNVRRSRAAVHGDDPAFRFHHILVRDAAYQSLLKRARATLHERFIEWAEPVLADAIRELYEDPTMRTPRLGVSAEAAIVPIKRPGRRGPRIYAKPPYVPRKPRRV